MATVKRIDKLTPEQQARFPEWRDKWIKIGLSTEPADRKKFEAAVARCYLVAGLTPPKRVVWVQSPIALALAAPIAAVAIELFRRKDVRGAVDGAVGGAVRDARSSREQLAPLARKIIEAIPNLWYRLIGGQFWVGSWAWYGSPSFVSFFRDVCELDLGSEMNDRAQAYRETAESACWWWPHKEFVIACDRPDLISRDDRGRLHSTTGPAIRFRDGWGVYSVHGVRVPGDIIDHPETITPARILAERNAEIRRVMIDKYGVAKFLLDAGAKELHRDIDGLGHPRVLRRIELADDEPLVMVEVINSTPEPEWSEQLFKGAGEKPYKRYFLRVHPELRPLLADGKMGEPQKPTVHNAVASTFGKRGEDYHPILET